MFSPLEIAKKHINNAQDKLNDIELQRKLKFPVPSTLTPAFNTQMKTLLSEFSAPEITKENNFIDTFIKGVKRGTSSVFSYDGMGHVDCQDHLFEFQFGDGLNSFVIFYEIKSINGENEWSFMQPDGVIPIAAYYNTNEIDKNNIPGALNEFMSSVIKSTKIDNGNRILRSEAEDTLSRYLPLIELAKELNNEQQKTSN